MKAKKDLDCARVRLKCTYPASVLEDREEKKC
jgi:hypothetical protein